ncbi:MAG: MauE/DoxX family redox-associated membrane protein [Pseudobacter sp.]|uniref:MauE/DoxX family redox-associated membrane protein n=1 Tax=Pseudobacter sp. TaxID=2045420 RepID=UPI003F81CAFE
MRWKQMLRREWISVILVAVYAVDCSACLQQWQSYKAWLNNLPFIGAWHQWLAYALSLTIITLLVLLIGGFRKAGWQLSLWMQVVFVSYLCMALLTTDVFFLPFHPWWDGMRWWDRMWIALAQAWLSWAAIRWDGTAAANSDHP